MGLKIFFPIVLIFSGVYSIDIIEQVIQGASEGFLESDRGLFLWNNQLSNTKAFLRRIHLSLLFEYETKVYYG